MGKVTWTWRQARDELALLAAAAFCFGLTFGGAAYIGWSLVRGLVRIMGE